MCQGFCFNFHQAFQYVPIYFFGFMATHLFSFSYALCFQMKMKNQLLLNWKYSMQLKRDSHIKFATLIVILRDDQI